MASKLAGVPPIANAPSMLKASRRYIWANTTPISRYEPTAPMIRFTLMRPSRMTLTSSSQPSSMQAMMIVTEPSANSHGWSKKWSITLNVTVPASDARNNRTIGCGSKTNAAPKARNRQNARSSHTRLITWTSTIGYRTKTNTMRMTTAIVRLPSPRQYR